MIVSDHKSIDELILKKIREGEILKNDRRFHEYRTRGYGREIRITEADNKWFKGTAWKQYAVGEKRELFRLRAEVSERVEQRKMGLASILDFLKFGPRTSPAKADPFARKFNRARGSID